MGLQLIEKAALASTVATMPDAGLSLLEKRFAPDVSKPGESKPPEDSGPPSSPPQSSQQPDSQQPGTSSGPPKEIPEVDPKYRGTILAENLAGSDNGSYLKYGAGYLKNYTNLSFDQIRSILDQPMQLKIKNDDQPKVLIVHTHTTEAYEEYDRDFYDTRYTFRSTDPEKNMTKVGEVLCQTLNEMGVPTIQDKTLHDYPSYNGSYDRSRETINDYLKKYPSIQVVLDVHRDAIQREETLVVKAVAEVQGQKAAQLMMIAPCDDGTNTIPKWRENLRFAAAFQSQIETDYPQLTRPIFFSYRQYNMNVTPYSLLLEFGSHGNTLEENLVTARMVGESLGKLLKENMQ